MNLGKTHQDKDSSTGGKGGYSTGTITLTQDTILYVCVGGQGEYNTTFAKGGYNGGILGLGYSTSDGINLHNCYNVGDIDGLDGFTGGVVGQGAGMDSVSNCYYLNTCGANGLGVAMAEDAMRTPDFVATLNDNTDVWNMDEDNYNSGFPILMGLDMAVDEVLESGLAVYPNPTQGTLRIEGGHFEEVEIFNVLGVRVMQRNLHGSDGTATLDVSTLTDGLYLLRVTDAQKAYRICQFVVRH